MQRLTVALDGRSYPIHVGTGLLERLGEFIAPMNATSLLIVSDENVAPLYADRVMAAVQSTARASLLVLPAGEDNKRWDNAAKILDRLVDLGADRQAVVVALGGGVIGDVAGFAASLYMRGVRYVQVPTTLLAQVDSSVGGKTAINHPRGKNLIGTFHQPAAVVSDTLTLQTLPAREVTAGLAEVIKHGLLADAEYFAEVRTGMSALRALEPAALARAILRSCEIKAGIVARDEKEAGERALLNLGHTFAHAIEAMTGYTRWLHGEAVGCGLVLAGELSRRSGLLGSAEVREIAATVAAAGLPSRVEGLSATDALAAMRADKKALAGQIGFIVLQRIGKAVQRPVPDELVIETLREGGFQ
jgi:3-dehydroquinate synthase